MHVRRIFLLITKTGLWLGTGYILLLFTFHLCQGNEYNFDLGDGYWLNRWPGALIHWTSPERNDWNDIFRERVTAFYIHDPWVVGRTTTAWFAVHKIRHESHYPLASVEDIRRITGLTVAESDLVTDPTASLWLPSRYELIWPWTPKYVALVGVVYFAVSIVFWLAIRRSRRSENLTNGRENA